MIDLLACPCQCKLVVEVAVCRTVTDTVASLLLGNGNNGLFETEAAEAAGVWVSPEILCQPIMIDPLAHFQRELAEVIESGRLWGIVYRASVAALLFPKTDINASR